MSLGLALCFCRCCEWAMSKLGLWSQKEISMQSRAESLYSGQPNQPISRCPPAVWVMGWDEQSCQLSTSRASESFGHRKIIGDYLKPLSFAVIFDSTNIHGSYIILYLLTELLANTQPSVQPDRFDFGHESKVKWSGTCGQELLWLEQFPKIGAGPSLLSSGALAAASEEVSLSQPHLGSLKPLLTQAHPSPRKDLPHCPPKYF